MTQTTGFSDPLWTMLKLAHEKFANARDGRIAFIRHVLALPPPQGPQKFRYENVNYLLAAAMIEQESGSTIEDLERERIFVPLGMASAGFGAPGHPGALDAPEGHGGRSVFDYPLPWLLGERAFDPGDENADVPGWLDCVGLVHADISDWARFVASELKSHPANPGRMPGLLRPETEAALTTPDPVDQSYNGGWYLTARLWAKGTRAADRGVVLTHQGDNGRWSSVAYVAPEIDFAILIVPNRTGRAKGLDEIAQYFVGRFASPTDQPR